MPKGWRRNTLLPREVEYETDDTGRMHDTGEWRWAVPGILADIPGQIEATKSMDVTAPGGITDEQLGAGISLAGAGVGALRGGKGTALSGNYKEMLHGTNAPTPFDELKPGTGDDIHLSDSPYIAEMFSSGGADPWQNLPEGAARIYPVLFDPGKKPFLRDYGMPDAIWWDEPEQAAKIIRERLWQNPLMLTPEIAQVLGDLDKGMTVMESIGKRGYTSLEFEHASGEPGKMSTAYATNNPNQITPKYSPEGMLAQKKGRVKPIDYSKYPDQFKTGERGENELTSPDFLDQWKGIDDPRIKELMKYWYPGVTLASRPKK